MEAVERIRFTSCELRNEKSALRAQPINAKAAENKATYAASVINVDHALVDNLWTTDDR